VVCVRNAKFSNCRCSLRNATFFTCAIAARLWWQKFHRDSRSYEFHPHVPYADIFFFVSPRVRLTDLCSARFVRLLSLLYEFVGFVRSLWDQNTVVVVSVKCLYYCTIVMRSLLHPDDALVSNVVKPFSYAIENLH